MQIVPLRIRKLLPPQDSLLRALDEAVPVLHEGDIVCIASKVVAIHQGRTRKMTNDKFQLSNEKRDTILSEAEWVDDESRPFLTIKNGQFIPFAGVDESNGNGYYMLWPEDPMGTAAAFRTEMREKSGVRDLGIIITDSTCLPLRNGTVGTAIGFAGFDPILDYRGTKDLFGRTMELSRVNVADGLAAAATLVMGEGDEVTPVAIIRDAPGIVFTDTDHSRDVRIDAAEDVFAPILSSVMASIPPLPHVPTDWSAERPFFTLLAVASLDGVIAPEPGKAVDWASAQDQEWFHRMLPTFDATILGRNTYRAISAGNERNRVVLTSSVNDVIQENDHTWFLNPQRTDLSAFCREKGWMNVGVSGGGETYGFFVRSGWADRLLLTVEPLTFGEGTRLFSGSVQGGFCLTRSTRLNAQGTLLLQYDAQRA